MTIIYRLLSVVVNMVAVFLAASLAMSLPMVFTSPPMLLPAFMMAAIVLYAWFSYKFHRDVLQKKVPVKKSLRDWIRVNGIVTMIYGFIIIASMAMVFKNPQIFVEQIKQYGVEFPVENLNNIILIFLLLGIVWVVHVLWTFALVKKNKAFFQ